MMWNKEKQSLSKTRTHSLEQAEERVEELAMLKNYYKKTAEEQREIIDTQDKILINIEKLISNYEINNTNPFTLIRDIKNELDESGKRI